MALKAGRSFQTVESLISGNVKAIGTEEQKDTTVKIEINKLVSFKNHPFKVIDNEEMEQLVESVKEHGVLSPLLVRKVKGTEGIYEIISGHRRCHAAAQAGLKEVPVTVLDITDDEAIILMVDSNIQRTTLLPSEKAFSLRMKMEALKRQGKREDLTSDHNGQKSDWSRKQVADEAGISGTQVQRYIRLTYLIPELMQMTDDKRIPFNSAVDMSYLSSWVQMWVCEYVTEHGTPKLQFITELKNAAEKKEQEKQELDKQEVFNILLGESNKKRPAAKVSFSEKKLNKYFPAHFTAKQREEIIIELLEKWKAEQE